MLLCNSSNMVDLDLDLHSNSYNKLNIMNYSQEYTIYFLQGKKTSYFLQGYALQEIYCFLTP